MRAVVALGNPGPEYRDTPHNAGFLLADVLAERWRFPRFSRDGRALVSNGMMGDQEVILVKPQTYMNLSGAALSPLLAQPGFDVSRDLLVVVDDIALPLGSFRLRAHGSAGGHNGLKSVEAALGSREYARLRIGIGPKPEDVDDQADYLLARWLPEERAALEERVPLMMEAVECWVTDGIDEAMNRYNRRGMERD